MSKKGPAKETKKSTKKTAKPDEYFFFADGRVAKSVKEMAFMLDDISHEVFSHHVNEARNDFSAWVESIFDEKELAEILKQESEIAKLQMKMMRHLAKKYA